MCRSTTPKCFKIQPVFTRTYAQSPLISNCLHDHRLAFPETPARRLSHTRQRHTLCRSGLQHGIVAWRGVYSHSCWMKRDSALVLWCCESPLIGTYVLTTSSCKTLRSMIQPGRLTRFDTSYNDRDPRHRLTVVCAPFRS